MKDKQKHILIIDPDTQMRNEYLSLFSADDCEIDVCSGITKAIEKIQNIRFDCIIMDVELPDLEGYKAVPILKTIDPKVEVIITAAQNSLELEAKIRKENIFYYYIKTFKREELKLAVENVFKKLGKDRKKQKIDNIYKILIVDDDPDYTSAIKTILSQKGYKVDIADNKDTALEKINKTKPDLILLDIMMERLNDGFTICYELKHNPTLKHIPILAISAITEKTGLQFSPETNSEYFEADDYVEKPIHPADLLHRINKLLNIEHQHI
ncbi:response regulator [bacterium]|nr:response regulator [bacterium]